jgi:DNA-binding MarR family transcriptional regulator
MSKEVSIPKYYPKGEVLRKSAERYPDIDADVMEIMRHVKRLSSGNECVFQAALEPFNLSEGRFYVLCCLFAEEIAGHKAPSPSEIAEQLGVTRATITGLLDGLERDGYLERRHDSADRRALTIHMAAKGRETLEAFIPQQCRRANAQMACLSPEEKQTLIALLAKIQS